MRHSSADPPLHIPPPSYMYVPPQSSPRYRLQGLKSMKETWRGETVAAIGISGIGALW